MSEKKVSGKVLMFTGIVIIVFLIAIFGFIFWEPVPEIIQGEAEATEVRISGKVPGRIERFLVDEGDQVKKGDTVAILDSPEVMAKFNQAQAAEEAARKRVAGAFGKGAQMGSKGTTEGTGIQGSPTGNAPEGASSGTGGYGTFDLGGRSIGQGGLPRPAYNVQDEGIVVVSITVNPAGHVIATSIDRKTNTINSALRKAAEDAAKKARFNAVSGLNNQTGTITYYFKLK